MSEVSKEKADALLAAWDAASLTQRLVMDRVSWVTVDTTSYYLTKPSELERRAAARIEYLEMALSFYARGGNVAETIEDATRGDIDLSRASEVLTDDCGHVARQVLKSGT